MGVAIFGNEADGSDVVKPARELNQACFIEVQEFDTDTAALWSIFAPAKSAHPSRWDGENNLEGGQVLVEVSYGFDAAEIVFKIEMFIGSVGVFIGQAEADEDAGNFKGIVHLGDERDRAAFANEDSFFVEALFESGLGALKNGRMIRGGPGLAGAEDFEFAMD